ncbi:MAG: hypothetical protein A3E05_01610, partial [Candidatus Jacksonbacteria bacterium RIFCSPHIGHO2_12_FULL_44_12]
LGLANHPKIKECAIKAIEKYGVASGGVRLISGTMDIHQMMEKELALFTHYEDALTTGTGFGTNTGLIPAIINLLGSKVKISLFTKDDVILSDELNHASIIDGCRLSKAKVITYSHNDVDDLKSKLVKYKKRRKLIVTDGVFSMDGDIAPLDKIVELAQRYKALTMVDDAHAIGVLGKTGGGTAQYCGVEGKVDINMGTMSKGLGCAGGFVSGGKELIEYLRIACRSYVFSDSMPPVIAASVVAVLGIIKNSPDIRDTLDQKATYFRNGMQEMGFDTLNSATQIIPWLIGDEKKTIEVSKLLFENGIFAPAVRWPAVPKKMARIRFNIMATHTRIQLNRLLSVCEQIGKRFKRDKRYV